MKAVSCALTVLVLGLALGACVTPIGSGKFHALPEDTASQCAKQCESIGMKLSAVAIMAANVGCVCGQKESVAESTAATAGGMVTLMLQEEARRQQQQQNTAGR